MARVLLGWEFGAGLGHVAILAPIARALRERGHATFVALRNPTAARRFLDPPIHVLQAPYWHMPLKPLSSRPTETLAEMFFGLGYAEAALLGPMVRAWVGMIAAIDPEVVVADFAPTLALAAHGRLPTFTVGLGYSIPPRGRRLPNVRGSIPDVTPEAAALEDRITASVARVQAERSRPAPAFFADLLSTETTFVCTVPLLDPYRDTRDVEATGPLGDLRRSPIEGAGPGATAGGFAYLAADSPNLGALCRGLSRSGVQFEAFVRGIAEGEARGVEGPGLRIHTVPQDLLPRLQSIAVLVHHGGLATTHQALWAGVPQVIVPKTLEQAMTMHAIERAGLGTALLSTALDAEQRLVDAVRQLLDQPQYAERARATRDELIAKYGDGVIDRVVSAIEGRMRGGDRGG